ncbi:hypothetical protein [Anaerotignum sp.]|uniref:hypothetical protein n=1 Tax=Anaerotignum sp. TaxID=2039241 RepID=UPI0028A2731A|nr:hypothetical protein [Anaerotignum sp.]
MNKKFLGSIFILVGLCKLSLEIYGLKALQLMDKASRTEFCTSPWSYFSESTVVVSFLITLVILITGLILIVPKEWWR